MNKVFLALIVSVGIIIVIIYAAIAGWFHLALRNEIRPLEAIALGTNLFIAFFLQRFVNKQMNDLRAEKTVMINSVTEIIRTFNELRDFMYAEMTNKSIAKKDFDYLVNGFRRVANALYELNECMTFSAFSTLNQHLMPIRKQVLCLKKMTTGGAYPSKGYSIALMNAQGLQFRQIATLLRKLIFIINREEK